MWSHHPNKKIAVWIPDAQAVATEKPATEHVVEPTKKPAKAKTAKKPAAKK